MSLFNNSVMMGASGAVGAYEIERSLRFDKTDDQNLQFTPSSDGNRRTWTFSCWLKRSVVGGGSQTFFRCREGSYPKGLVMARFLNDELDILRWNGASAAWQVQTNRLFRDPSSWYHIVIAYDTTQGTAANRVKLYVNGTQETDLGEDDYPNQNSDYEINTQFPHEVGVASFDGYMADVYFIDGQQLTPSSFGETNGDTGQWRPIEYGGTYGTNGFFLEFKDNSAATAAAIGKDTSGNGHNFTPSDISVAAGIGNDSFIDTPTNNFCTWNSAASTGTIDKGGTHRDGGGYTARGTTILKNNKYYFEVKIGTSTGTADCIGVARINGKQYERDNTKCAHYFGNGEYKIEGANQQSGWSSYDTDDVIGCAIDTTQSPAKIWFAKNNTWQNSGNPSTGANGIDLTAGEDYVFSHDHGSGANTSKGDASFGGNEYHAYTPPTDFVSACTANLPEPTIINALKHFEVMTWSGTGANQNYTLNHTSGLFWGKRRNSDHHWQIFDSIMGDGYALSLNNTYAKYGFSGHAFGTNQITIPYSTSDSYSLSDSGDTYVGYSWKAAESTVTNNDGTITSQVRANPTAGFSIVSYTVPNSNDATMGHGLGVTPVLAISKNLSDTSDWSMQFINKLDNSTDYMFVNKTDAAGDTSTYFTSSTVKDGFGSGSNGDSIIQYVFSEVEGYSKVGAYLGNGSDDGTFIYTGFRPAWLIYHRMDSAKPWYGNNSVISEHNEMHNTTLISTNAAEQTSSNNKIDFLSNGWKIREGATSTLNADGGEYFYMAFAERPFKYANAR